MRVSLPAIFGPLISAGWPSKAHLGHASPARYMVPMCGRITQKSPPNQLGLRLVPRIEPLHIPPRYNGAPGQEHWVIRQHPKTGERTLDRLWWGLIPHWCRQADGGRKPVNTRRKPSRRFPHSAMRIGGAGVSSPSITPSTWKAIKGLKLNQPYAIGLKSVQPFASRASGRTGSLPVARIGCARS